MSWMFALDIVCCPVSVNNHLVFPIEVFQTLFLHKEILHKLDRSITNACSVAEMRHHLHVVSFQCLFSVFSVCFSWLRTHSFTCNIDSCPFKFLCLSSHNSHPRDRKTKTRAFHSLIHQRPSNEIPLASFVHYIDFCLSCSFDDVFHFLFLSRFFDDGEKGWVVKSLICSSLRPAVVFLDSISSHIPVSEV